MTQPHRQQCHLAHPGFHLLGEPVFRLSEGQRIASMVVQLDSQEAVLPLRSVAREFAIDPGSADGQMLTLIEQALEFVVALRLGDPLPSELNGGEASWDPTPADRRKAASRVRYELVRCVLARLGEAWTVEGGAVPGWEELPSNRPVLARALVGAAAELGLADAGAVAGRLDALGQELAHIETMRRVLTRGMAGPREKLLKLRADQVPASRRDILHQVQLLTRRGLKEIGSRLDEVDARLDDMLGMLRDVPVAVTLLRRHRDWLYRSKLAWEPVFTGWAGLSGEVDEFLWKVVERTYAFLAPRFMSYQEWTQLDAKPKQRTLRATVW